MKVEDFIAALKEMTFLGEERRKLLTENAPWMNDQEREQLHADLTGMASEWEKNDQAMMEELSKVEETLDKFKKEELPKLMQEEESTEAEEEEKTAEKLLESFDDSSA